jgi:hypothetical protein
MNQPSVTTQPLNEYVCVICNIDSVLLYTCGNHKCKSLYCHECIKQWRATASCPKTCALCRSSAELTDNTSHTTINLAPETPNVLSPIVSAQNAQPENQGELALAVGMHSVIHVIILYHFFTTSPSDIVLVLCIMYMSLSILHWLVFMYKLRATFVPHPTLHNHHKTIINISVICPLCVVRIVYAVFILPAYEMPIVIGMSVVLVLVECLCW